MDELFLDVSEPPQSLKGPFRHSIIFIMVPGEREMTGNAFKSRKI